MDTTKPRAHSEQAVARDTLPTALPPRPAGQVVQLEDPANEEKEPEGQGEQLDAPAAANVPGLHGCSSEPAPPAQV